MDYIQLASQESIDKTVAGLKSRGMDAEVFENAEGLKKRVLEIIPEGAKIMNMTSVTLTESGVLDALHESKKYIFIKDELAKMTDPKDELTKKAIAAAPEWTIGSCHALTENGEILVASNTGSQIPAYVYGAMNVVFVVSAKKIVPDVQTGMQRIYDYVLPLENDRAMKAYGVGSNVSKLLLINKEVQPGRIRVLLVKEAFGF